MHDSENNGNSREVIFSKAVKAGKRTYFFDVKSTRANDFFITITESKKKFNMGDEKPFYEKHKIFLYKEDFEKFIDGLNEAVSHIRSSNASGSNATGSSDQKNENPFTNIDFDDEIR
jgi:hypothetical protein